MSAPIHPGELLADEFMTDLGLSPRQLAGQLGVPLGHVREIMEGRRVITLGMSERLGKLFNQSETFWFALQADHDNAVAAQGAGGVGTR
ncbi:HigA family addiction module antitoxin [Gordonia sp. SL306]|uniref:HigA family addiction module antitoxin n=1 Tax=Gordonia sp. SL306 TaxID=2995145 RepID=UPI00226E7088|nr:HigA family addiction module antitoxin [Gordonia sp. SL306]WAC55028.1 HigA family addiction module antitoxin [Gordonia sp. SL306]